MHAMHTHMHDHMAIVPWVQERTGRWVVLIEDMMPGARWSCLWLGHAHFVPPRELLLQMADADPQELFAQMQEMEVQHATQIAALQAQLKHGGGIGHLGQRSVL